MIIRFEIKLSLLEFTSVRFGKQNFFAKTYRKRLSTTDLFVLNYVNAYYSNRQVLSQLEIYEAYNYNTLNFFVAIRRASVLNKEQRIYRRVYALLLD